MRVAINTNAYVAFCKNVTEAVDALRRADSIILPLPAVAELRAGFEVGTKGAQNESVLQRFLNSKRVSIALPDMSTTFVYARLYNYLRKNGTHILTNDLWISAITLQNDATLLTCNNHFDKLPQIPKWF